MLTITPHAAQQAAIGNICPSSIMQAIQSARRRVSFHCHEVLYDRTNRLMLIILGGVIVTVYQMKKKEVKAKLSGMLSDDILNY